MRTVAELLFGFAGGDDGRGVGLGFGLLGVEGFVGTGAVFGTGIGTATTTTGIVAALLLPLPPEPEDAEVGSSSRMVWHPATARVAKPNRSARFGFVMASPPSLSEKRCETFP